MINFKCIQKIFFIIVLVTFHSSVIAQKKISDSLVRSMSQYATSDQIKQYLKDNQIDLSPIQKDIEKLRGEPGSDRKIMFLSDYIDYLKDEIKEAERANRVGTSTK